ncbi:MAG: von Willebrand factor type A domain-containing protein, partial [Saprospiraceae bacterium]|nr:von Willebrand factor type A domain-containing protein [Saprospiraceae bacterium]
MKTILIAICCLFGLQFLNYNSSHYLISGRVTESDTGNPAIGATINVQGTRIGTVTDFEGYYKLEIPQKKCTLIFRMTGFTEQKFQIDSSQTLNVQMEIGAALHEVVVTGMSGSTRHKYQSEVGMPAPSMRQIAPSEEIINWNTEDYDLIQENGFVSTDEQQLSTFSIDVDRASYSNIRRFITQGVKAPVDAVRIEEMVNYFDYSYPEPKGEDPLAIYTEMGVCPWNPDHHLLHIGVQSEKIKTDFLPASNLVFLIDVSGSMNQANKLPLLISSFRLLIDQIRPQDRVSIVTYAGASGILLDGVGGNDKEKILESINQLTAGGATAGADGISTAYKIAKKNFIENGNNR